MLKGRNRIGLLAVCISLSAGCAACGEEANNETNNATNNESPITGAGDGLVAACTNAGVSDGPLSQDGVTCGAPAGPTIDDCGARTPVSGTIQADQTLSGCLSTDGLEIEQGVTVTVEAGTSLQFTDANASIQNEGTIVAAGTAEDPISFVGSTTAGSWGGIRLLGTSVSNVFDHVVFENGGGFDWNTSSALNAMLVVQATPTQVDISNTTFRGSSAHAVHVAVGDTNVTFDNVGFEDNAEAAIVLPPNQVGALNDTLTFGADQWVDVTAGTASTDQTWPACVPLRFTGGVDISGDALVTVQAGATLTFRADGYLRIAQGALNAVGTADTAIFFTGAEDMAGAWGGINFESETTSEDNVLDHVVIEDAGGFDWNTSNVQNTALAAVEETVRLRVRDSVIRNSSALGFFANSALADVDFQNVEFEANAEAAASVPPNHISAFDGSTVYGADQNVVVREGTSSTAVDADSCVPYLITGIPNFDAASTLTMQPGTRFTFAEDAGIEVGGTLSAVGAEDNVITWTGVDAEPGSWAGARFNGDIEANIDWLILEYGGSFDWNTSSSANANLNIQDAEATISIANTTVRGSSADGIHFNADPTLTCDNVLVEDSPAVTGAFDRLEDACD